MKSYIFLIFLVLSVGKCFAVERQTDKLPELKKTSIAQQKAISNLVKALKEFKKKIKKEMDDEKPASEEKEQEKITNPFDKKQDFFTKKNIKNNPEKKLEKITKCQAKLLEKLKEKKDCKDKSGKTKEKTEKQSCRKKDNNPKKPDKTTQQKSNCKSACKNKSGECNQSKPGESKSDKKSLSAKNKKGDNPKKSGKAAVQKPKQKLNADKNKPENKEQDKSGESKSKKEKKSGANGNKKQQNKSTKTAVPKQKTAEENNQNTQRSSANQQNKNFKQLAVEQQQISKDISNMRKQKNLGRELKNPLKNALKTSKKVENTLENKNQKQAVIKAEETKSHIDKALENLRKKSDKSLNDSLNNSLKKLNEANHKALENGMKTGESLKEIVNSLNKDAKHQIHNGKLSNAEISAELARDFTSVYQQSAKDDKIPPGTYDKLRGKISSAILKIKTAEKILTEEIRNLQNAQKQLKFLKKHPEEFSRTQKKQLVSDIEASLNKAMNTLSEVSIPEEQKNNIQNASRLLHTIWKSFSKVSNDTSPPENLEKLSRRIEGLVNFLQRHLTKMRATDDVYNFNPDEIPEKYRDEVRKYFERLSEGKGGKKGK